jgi:fused signal recognition particle receptor
MTSTSPDSRDSAGGGLFNKLRSSLKWGKNRLGQDLRELFRRGTFDETTREELEARLLQADVGVEATGWLLSRLEEGRAKKDAALEDGLKIIEQGLQELLQNVEQSLTIDRAAKPFVILVVGVNGTGKTTTIGKLAQQLVARNYSVMLAAGDTFRAAAVEQLSQWGKRTGAAVVAQADGADPAAVIFDALASARARGIDVVIADTAGRLHTSSDLMDELKKIKRVMGKIDAAIPHETLLVLDASQGQNALVQAREFNDALGVSGLVVTKLDGTAKGGILVAIARQLGLPVRFIGTGEGAGDLEPFNAQTYTKALLGDAEQ